MRPYILGYTCVNDVTARDLQSKDGQWTRAKGFDTFCPVGTADHDKDEIDPWAGVGLETRVDGTVKQQGNTKDFIFMLDLVIRYISQVMTLLPGDLIPTGTPSGVGPVNAGESMEVIIEGIGTLKNPVSCCREHALVPSSDIQGFQRRQDRETSRASKPDSFPAGLYELVLAASDDADAFRARQS